jgi:hypothetical protein
MIEMQVWSYPPETPLVFILPGKKERKKIIRKKLNVFFSRLMSFFGIACIIFIIFMGTRPYQNDNFDKTKSSVVIELDRLQALCSTSR